MAGGEDYIPIRTALVDDPDVLLIANLVKAKDPDLIVGKLVRFWSWAARVTADGRLGPYTEQHIDSRVVACRGFCAALETFRKAKGGEGWLTRDRETGELVIPKFDEWMSKAAKARAGEAVRKDLQRRNPDKRPDIRPDKCPDKCLDQRREEERRETTTPSSGGAAPAAEAAEISNGGGGEGVSAVDRTRYEALILAGVSPTTARKFVAGPYPTLESIRRVRDTRKARDLPADNGLIGALKTAAEQDRIRDERRKAAQENPHG